MGQTVRTTTATGLALAVALGVASAQAAHTVTGIDPLAQRTNEMASQEGFLPVHYDETTGRLFLEVSKLGEQFIYANALAQGVGGLNPRLDRGMLEYSGRQALVRFERRGNNLLLIAENLNFRARDGTDSEVRAVAESFPSAVYAAFPIDTEHSGRFLVDATPFLLSDVFDIGGRLRGAGQGTVRIDQTRSYVSMDYTRSFPRNTEIRSAITYFTDDPGQELIRHAPDGPLGGRTTTLQQHHSFVALPPSGFQPRRFDPRVGSLHTTFRDFSQSYDGDYRARYIQRWRLEKRHPSADVSEPIQPIVFYVDPAIPEPYRTAYIEGTLWWNEHLEAAGFRNAIEVRDLPDDADPMDVRYSTILLVHRTAPGSSTAPHIQDPRTGEILHAIVRMDSHRSLTNFNYYMGLLPALRGTGSEIALTAEEMIILRRKQHIAHEIGHALGFDHNHIAAALGRSSVMDYPPPLVQLNERGGLDISQMYHYGGGAHDTFLARYAYTPFNSSEEEDEGLGAIVREALAEGRLSFVGRDAALNAAYPEVSRWVEGTSMIEALERTIHVRRILLDHFNEEAVLPGEPMALLANRLTHVYMHHLYSLQAAIKCIGGMRYTYAFRDDGQDPTRILPAAEQRRALELIVSALSPDALVVPERISELIPPVPGGHDPADRWVWTPTGATFDPLALPRSLATSIVDGLLHRERASRVVSQHARDASNPSLQEVIQRLVDATWYAPRLTASIGVTLMRITERAVLDGLFSLAADQRAPAEVRSVAHLHLVEIAAHLEALESGPADDLAHRNLAKADVQRFIQSGETPPVRTGIRVIELPWP